MSRLPPAHELSLAERLHAPLIRAIPEVGIRLGALAATLALIDESPIEEWLWLVDPLDERTFGKVVRSLLKRRFPDKTKEEMASLVTAQGTVAWRTIERWYAGTAEVPNKQGLVELGDLLGEGAEPVLRLARLAARFRASLGEWIGEVAAAQWLRQVAIMGRTAARFLSSPTGVAMLLGWLRGALAGPHGERVYETLRQLWSMTLSRSALSAGIAEAQTRCNSGDPGHPAARWAVLSTMLDVPPPLSLHLCAIGGSSMLGLLSMTSFERQVGEEWKLRLLLKALTAADPQITRSDGSKVQISETAKEAVRRWEASSLQFEDSGAHDAEIDIGVWQAFVEAFGRDAFARLDGESLSIDLIGIMFDPGIEEVLPDDEVRERLPLSLARARRLLRAGDWDGARPWFPDLRTLRAPLNGAEISGLIETYAALGHYLIDDAGRLRALHRVTPPSSARDQARDVLSSSLRVAETFVEQILRIGEAPTTSYELLAALVHAIPVAIRVMLLREELEATQEGLHPTAVGELVAKLAQCIEHHPTHGAGWALLAMWHRMGQDKEAEHAEKQATHFGAGDMLESEWMRIERDLGLAGSDAPLADAQQDPAPGNPVLTQDDG